MLWSYKHSKTHIEILQISIFETSVLLPSCLSSSVVGSLGVTFVAFQQWSRNRGVTISRLIRASVALLEHSHRFSSILNSSEEPQRKLSRELEHRMNSSRPLHRTRSFREQIFRWRRWRQRDRWQASSGREIEGSPVERLTGASAELLEPS